MKSSCRNSNAPSAAKSTLIGFFTVWFCYFSIVSNPVLAQSTNTDFESPIIEHESVASANWGEVQIFEASVVDNDEVKRVRLFFRYGGDLEYTEVQMQQLASSSSYTASVDTSVYSEPRDTIEYYIRAEDASDNLVLKGFSFEPLVRVLVNDTSQADNEVEPAVTAPVESETVQKGSRMKWLYVALGVLVIGGLAAGGGGGGGGGSATGTVGTGTCDPNCAVTLSITTP